MSCLWQPSGMGIVRKQVYGKMHVDVSFRKSHIMRSFRVLFVLLVAGTSQLWQCKGKSPEQVTADHLTVITDTALTSVKENVPLARAVDSIYVVKHQRRMYVYNTGQLLKMYRISLGQHLLEQSIFKETERLRKGCII